MVAHTGRLSGKVAFITGGGGGFGAGIVQKFAREEAQVVVVDTQPSFATKFNDALQFTQVVGLQEYVASEKDRGTVLEYTIRTFHHLDVGVNNAGVSPGAHSNINTPEQDCNL